VSQPHNLPDINRMSVISATILLAYASSRFVTLPAYDLGLQLPGIYLSIELNVNTMISLLVSALTAIGTDWMISNHPALRKKKTYQHLILPGLTAWVIAVSLLRLPFGFQWILGFTLSSAILILVMVAEYVTVDPDDIRHPLATAFLTAISFTLYLILAIALRSAGVRLFQILPAMTLASLLVTLRTLHLRLQGRWFFYPAFVLAVVIAQFTAAVHYWPLSPITFGLVLLGPAYAFVSLIINITEGEPFRKAIVEPVLALFAIFGLAAWLQ